jgi:hypothetical protein
MSTQSDSCAELAVTGVPALGRPSTGLNPDLVRGRRAVERLNRVKELNLENTRSRAAQIKAMISDFHRMASELEVAIRAEQERTGIHDPAHFAYSTVALAMIRRRDNLKRSINDLNRQLGEGNATLE